jgi:hypothetical protein
MRIPINSTFTKEISKKFKRIFNPQTTFEEIQNLQEESYMGSHVDNYDKSTHKEKVLLEKLFKLKQKKKELAFKLHHLKYHQPTL